MIQLTVIGNIGNDGEEEPMAKAQEVPINPFTGEAIPIEEVQYCLFRPESRKYNPACSIRPFEPQKVTEDVFEFLLLKDVKEIMKTILKGHNTNKLDENHNFY